MNYPIGTEIFIAGDDDIGILAAKEYASRFQKSDIAIKRRTDEYGTRICVINLKPLEIEW